MCDICGNTTEADETGSGAAQPQQRPSGCAPVPTPFARGHRVLENTPKQSKPQRDGVVRDLVEAIVGDVRDYHAVLIRSFHVHYVDADPVATDRLAPFELGYCLARNASVLL